MYVNTKLTLMALFLLQFAYLTQTRHIVSRSTDEDCTAKNVTKNAAACFLSKDFTDRLDGLKISVELEHNLELNHVATIEESGSFFRWQGAWNPCPSSKWAISYLLAEAVKGTTQFKEDYLNVLGRTSIGTSTEKMNVLIISVKSLLSELKCEIKSMLENCPLLSGYPESDISMVSLIS
ncbi:uncharacterized protein LOC115924200 [Strongylocentrotus purpuratus]|uniref:Uncharacterized protein n=1 Tax=Strongylocentrotus purpuratus TaxID=7668 RepID=A0A7M7NV38_STRPU|nr:uncharacterized protein LOC115924200 [Strongylocentrotus purpuratus]